MKLRYLTISCLLLTVSVAFARDLRNRDVYYEVNPVPASSTTQLTRLTGHISSMDKQRGVPTFVWSNRATAERAPHQTPEDAAIWYLGQYATAYRLTKASLSTSYVSHVHDTGRGGIIVQFQQRIGDIDVIRNRLNVLMDRNLELVAITGNLHEAAVVGNYQFGLSPERALARVLSDVSGAAIGGARIVDTHHRKAGYGYYDIRPGSGLARAGLQLSEPARVKPVFYPLPDRIVPAYFAETLTGPIATSDVRGHAYVISADDGALLMRENLTVSDVFNYRVWAEPTGLQTPADDPMGDYTPHPSNMPNGFFPGYVPSTVVSMEGFNTNPMGMSDPWLPSGATETTGNNVDAYADITMPDGFNAGDIRADVTSTNTFDHTYNPLFAPNIGGTQIKGAVTQLFYVNNWLHDFFYDSGFDEAGRNAQLNNFGRGGVGGDPIRAEGQDHSGTNNANMTTPGDGGSPRMQMYIFNGPGGSVNRDGTLDNAISAHEWGHYYHRRLIDSCGNKQCAALSEGWGDIIALHLLIREGDNYKGAFAAGGYAPAIFGDATYFGIRRAPYTSNQELNGFTFRHIADGEPLPNHPLNTVFANNPNSEIHNAGELWALFFHEAYTSMLFLQTTGSNPTATFDEVKRKMADYLTAGLMITPVDATFNEQRDAVLAAAYAQNPDDGRLMAEAMAVRGGGSCAQSPDRNSTTFSGVAEDFALRGRMNIEAVGFNDDVVSCDGDGYLDAGETGNLAIKVSNNGDEQLQDTTITVVSSNPNVTFPNGAAVNIPRISIYDSATASLDIAIAGGVIETELTELTVTASNANSCETNIFDVTGHFYHFDVGPMAIDTVESPVTNWTEGGTTDIVWSRVPLSTSNRVWYGQDLGTTSDTYLQSSPIEVSATEDFVVVFRHRYLFEEDSGVFYDGGVIEFSTDDGTSWQDVETLIDPNYSGPLSSTDGNPLAGRNAYSGPSTMWPNFSKQTLDFGTLLSSETVLLRFRIGTDVAVGDFGWQIDQIAADGVDNQPFLGLVDDADGCNTPPVADAGLDQAVMGGAIVNLNGTGSNDDDGDILTYQWVQESGPAVTLMDANTSTPQFAAPTLALDSMIGIRLTVSDGTAMVSDSVNITVMGLGGPPDAGVPDAAVITPDAMVTPDAGMNMPDAGMNMPDAGMDTPDADIPTPDADVTDPPDAGTVDPPDSGGCCQTGKTPTTGDYALTGLVFFGLLVLTRRRRLFE